MAIAIIGMLDEREPALTLLKHGIEGRGHEALLIDISIGTGAGISALEPDITCEDLARDGGVSAEEIRAMLARERDQATEIMSRSLGRRLMQLKDAGRLRGVIAVGGMTGTTICLPAMKALPFGFPKLLISSVAAMPAYAKRLSAYFGVRDITVMHSVVDTVGHNPLVHHLMANGAGAICGMVEGSDIPETDEKPALAITEFGFCDKGAHYVRERLESTFNIVSFHATGLGEKAAVDLVGQGLFEAFIDMVPAGFSEYILGGNRTAGPDRLDAGCRSGKPYILTPCGFDMISCGPIQRRDQGDPLWESRNLTDREILVQDAMRVQARTSVEEMRSTAAQVAERLNQAERKEMVKFVVPTQGFSSLGVEGGALFDPASDQAFVDALRLHLNPDIEIITVDTHINTPALAQAVVEALNRMNSSISG